MASASEDGKVGLYELPSGLPFALTEHTGRTWSVAFTPDQKTLISTSQDGSIKFWNLATKRSCLTLREGNGEVSSVALNREATLMATCGGDGHVRLWRAPLLDAVVPAGH